MKLMRTPLRSGSFVGWWLGVVLGLGASAWGQMAPSGGTPAVKPGITVERQGRLLVLSYGAVGADTQSAPTSLPEFAIYQGKRMIASGQFEYG